MAIRVTDEFGSRANPPDSAYPDGSLKNETDPGVSDDGSPLEARVGNDWEGFKQSSLSEAGIVANGNPDSVGNPQILDAIKSITDDRFNYDGLVYQGVGNISDYAGQQLQEEDKTNCYQFPDDSRKFYGPVQSQSFPITIPADPSGDNGWALVTEASQDYVIYKDSILSEGSIFPTSLSVGSQSTLIPIGVTRIYVINSGVENLLYLWELSGDFSSTPHTISNVSENAFAGYDVVTDQGTFEFQTKENLDYRLNLDSRGWGLIPSPKLEGAPTINQTSQIIKVREYVKDNQVTVKVPAGNVLCDGDALDFKDCTVGGFLGSGVDRTQFYAATDNASTPFFNLGSTGSDLSPTDSDIQFGNFGGFSLRANGKNVSKALSSNFYRRGDIEDIRAYGFGKSFIYDYQWLNSLGPMRSKDHANVGHEFGLNSLNALTCYGFEASSSVNGVRDYSFKNPNSLLLISPDSEGNGGGFYFEDGRSITLLNLHSEGSTTKLRTTQSSANGLCINIFGGASFNAPDFIKLGDNFQALTIYGLGLFDVGSDFSGVLWSIGAKRVVINNLTVVDSNKNLATRDQVRSWIKAALTSNVEYCSIDGEVIRSNGINHFYDQTDRYFNLTTSAGSPVDIPTRSNIERTEFTITASQRLSSTVTSTVTIRGTVNDSLALKQFEVGNIDNNIAQMVIGYNASTKRLTLDSSLSVSTDISIEYNRV